MVVAFAHVHMHTGICFLNSSCKCTQAKIGREKELEDSLQRLRGKNANIYSEMTEIMVIPNFKY